MKHLRKFNESSSPKDIKSNLEDIKSNLEDIFIDFSDRHIPVEVNTFLIHNSDRYREMLCSVQLGDEYASSFTDLDMIRILPSDNKDEFLRLYDYMESEGYDFLSIIYDIDGETNIDRVVNIGLGIDSYSNHLFNGIDETCYLKLFFRKIER